MPPLLAVGLAIATRRVVLSLLASVVAGCLILTVGGSSGGFFAGVLDFFHLLWDFIWNALPGDPDRRMVTAFSLFMGAMIGVIHKSGGMQGLVDLLRPLASNRRRGQLTSWLMGMIIFFDDYANTLLLGQTMRPVTDRLRISREKLAYIVDSTAAPIAGVSLLSTWVATEIKLIGDGYADAQFPPEEYSAFSIFLLTIPLRFYPIWAFLFVMLVAATRRDFGPMLSAERRAIAGNIGSEDAHLESSKALRPDADVQGRWHIAVVPIVAMILMVMTIIYLTGVATTNNAHAGETGYTPSLQEIVGNGNAYVALLLGSATGFLIAVRMAIHNRTLNDRQLVAASVSGARVMLLALAILWLAWALGDITRAPSTGAAATSRLATADYLSSLIRDGNISGVWMPTTIFLLAAFISFCTGTSWGTMTILMPLAIQTTYQVLGGQQANIPADHPIMLASVGSVLGGSIFGDHCSPISDTTVLSSRSSGCNHIAHVRTQMPYALLVGTVSIVFGTIPAAYGISPWILLPTGLIVLWVFLRCFGRDAEDAVFNPAKKWSLKRRSKRR